MLGVLNIMSRGGKAINPRSLIQSLVAQHNPEDEVEFLRSLAEAAKDEHIIVNAKQSVNGWLMKMRYGELGLKQLA